MPNIGNTNEQNIHIVDDYFGISRHLNNHGCHHGVKPATACSEQVCDTRDVQYAWISILQFSMNHG